MQDVAPMTIAKEEEVAQRENTGDVELMVLDHDQDQEEDKDAEGQDLLIMPVRLR